MTDLTVKLEEEQLEQFQQIAQRMGMKVDELVRLSVGEYVARHRAFESVAQEVLRKNDELYRRLAQ